MPKIWINLYRDLNACINIAHTLMRVVGWGSCEPTKPVCEGGRRKASWANAGSPAIQGGVARSVLYVAYFVLFNICTKNYRRRNM
jgi:hypothetical protein